MVLSIYNSGDIFARRRQCAQIFFSLNCLFNLQISKFQFQDSALSYRNARPLRFWQISYYHPYKVLLTFRRWSIFQPQYVEDHEWQLVHSTQPHVLVFFWRNEPFCWTSNGRMNQVWEWHMIMQVSWLLLIPNWIALHGIKSSQNQ